MRGSLAACEALMADTGGGEGREQERGCQKKPLETGRLSLEHLLSGKCTAMAKGLLSWGPHLSLHLSSFDPLRVPIPLSGYSFDPYVNVASILTFGCPFPLAFFHHISLQTQLLHNSVSQNPDRGVH